MFAPTALAAGPFCFLELNQKAVNQTFAPGAVSEGKTTSKTVLLDTPSKVQADSVVGATGPTKLKIDAPSTPAGFPRRVASSVPCRRSLTVFPFVETMSI